MNWYVAKSTLFLAVTGIYTASESLTDLLIGESDN